jgi:hypothetical protein
MTQQNAWPLPSMLLVVFITLKLCKVITWSWVWVLAPAWIPAIVVVVFVVVMVIALGGVGNYLNRRGG